MRLENFTKYIKFSLYVPYSELLESGDARNNFIYLVRTNIINSGEYQNHIKLIGDKYKVQFPKFYFSPLSIDEIIEILLEKRMYEIRTEHLVGFVSINEVITDFLQLLTNEKLKTYVVSSKEKCDIIFHNVKGEYLRSISDRIYGSNQFIFDYKQYIPLSILEKINKLEEELNNGKSDT